MESFKRGTKSILVDLLEAFIVLAAIGAGGFVVALVYFALQAL